MAVDSKGLRYKTLCEARAQEACPNDRVFSAFPPALAERSMSGVSLVLGIGGSGFVRSSLSPCLGTSGIVQACLQLS